MAAVSVMRMLGVSTLGVVTSVYALLVSLEMDSHVQQTKLQTLVVSIHGTHSIHGDYIYIFLLSSGSV